MPPVFPTASGHFVIPDALAQCFGEDDPVGPGGQPRPKVVRVPAVSPKRPKVSEVVFAENSAQKARGGVIQQATAAGSPVAGFEEMPKDRMFVDGHVAPPGAPDRCVSAFAYPLRLRFGLTAGFGRVCPARFVRLMRVLSGFRTIARV
jgi:hypothetical protein